MTKHISIREFEMRDIEKKIMWINDPANNRFLHYDLPLEYDKTCAWFERNKGRRDRCDMVIELDGRAVGLIGLLSIDRKNKKAEYYISMGDTVCKGKGIAAKATVQLLEYAFCDLKLEKVYLYTETENIAAQKMFAEVGFVREGLLKDDLYARERFVDRYVYGITAKGYFLKYGLAPICFLDTVADNAVYCKREDLIPYSFGGNKVRKGELFFREIDNGNYDCVVTYGTSHSNHCRIIANMAAARGLECHIICPAEVSEVTYNSRFMDLFGAEQTIVPVDCVHDTIEDTLAELIRMGKKPYFIPGGGHGNIGTEAYVRCYEEIRAYEQENRIHFDYLFLASGTGTTQAGLICGQLMHGENRHIVGISIARKNPRGREVIVDSVREYLSVNCPDIAEEAIQEATVFLDDYVEEGYGFGGAAVAKTILDSFTSWGMPLDSTYTGKAFYGMRQYLQLQGICGKTILFLHTGGMPLFFDDVSHLSFGETK